MLKLFTCRDLNPLYNSTLEASLLFGSGARAGVDRREQKKQAATHKAALLRKMRESQVLPIHHTLEVDQCTPREHRQKLITSWQQAVLGSGPSDHLSLCCSCACLLARHHDGHRPILKPKLS